MERDWRSRFHHHRMLSLSPKLNFSSSPLGIERLNTQPVSKNLHFIEDPAFQNDPLLQLSCGAPQFHLAGARLLSPFSEKFPGEADYCNKMEDLVRSPAPAQRRFLVFDQSGGKTTLNYFSGAETHVHCGTCPVERPHTAFNLKKEDPFYSSRPPGSNIKDENLQNNSEEDAREDTEELNALLYSDTDFLDEDEETSTGHSPSTMTDNGKRDFVEEIDSSTLPAKRQKLVIGYYDEASQMHSLETVASAALEDWAESVSGNDDSKQTMDESFAALSGTKRRERIRETVKILQSIFPTVNGKNAVDVIDEAIHCLRSLRARAKALGLNTL